MPRTRTPITKRRGSAETRRIKSKLGGRKSTKSALQLTDEELLKQYAHPLRNRDKNLLIRLIHRRGLADQIKV